MLAITKRLVLVTTVLVSDAFAASDMAKCDATTHEALERHWSVADLGPKVVSEACKTWPYDTHLTLAAMAYDEGVAEEKTLLVATVDQQTKRVAASYKTAIVEDAITEVGEDSLQLDTAPYQLAGKTRAFGVRFSSIARGASCGEANWNDELTLYVPAGRQLNPVLTLSMSKQNALKGCLSGWSSEAVWETANLTLGVAKTSSHGYADLLVTAAIATSANNENAKLPKARVEHYLLRYDGKQYHKDGNARWWLAF